MAALEAKTPEYGGFFPAILNRHSLQIPGELPPALPGQRQNDRAFRGANLLHDFPTLQTARALGKTGLANGYLRAFSRVCDRAPSGLFPWGEHLYFDFERDEFGNSFHNRGWDDPLTHDHLLQCPFWLWESLWALNSGACQKFGRGLDNHWRAGQPPEYNRHAIVESVGPHPKRQERSCDFPRHAGFYLFDWAFLWQKTENAEWLSRIEKISDYWWERRDQNSGLCAVESRTPPHETQFWNVLHPGQTFSLALSSLESARLLGQNPLVQKLEARAQNYARAFFDLPHFESNATGLVTKIIANGEHLLAPVWNTKYGETSSAACVGSLLLAWWKQTRDGVALELALQVARQILATPFPRDAPVVAKDMGRALEFFADLCEVTGEKTWRKNAQKLAVLALEIYFDDCVLPRRAAGDDWYESQPLVGYLLHGLARAGLASEGDFATLPADYAAR